MQNSIEVKLKIDKIIAVQNRHEELFLKRQRLSENNSVTSIIDYNQQREDSTEMIEHIFPLLLITNLKSLDKQLDNKDFRRTLVGQN